jgi:hypothetical protein
LFADIAEPVLASTRVLFRHAIEARSNQAGNWL